MSTVIDFDAAREERIIRALPAIRQRLYENIMASTMEAMYVQAVLDLYIAWHDFIWTAGPLPGPRSVSKPA